MYDYRTLLKQDEVVPLTRWNVKKEKLGEGARNKKFLPTRKYLDPQETYGTPNISFRLSEVDRRFIQEFGGDPAKLSKEQVKAFNERTRMAFLRGDQTLGNFSFHPVSRNRAFQLATMASPNWENKGGAQGAMDSWGEKKLYARKKGRLIINPDTGLKVPQVDPETGRVKSKAKVTPKSIEMKRKRMESALTFQNTDGELIRVKRAKYEPTQASGFMKEEVMGVTKAELAAETQAARISALERQLSRLLPERI